MNNLVVNARYAAYSLWLCLFPELSVLIAVLVLTRVPQGTEVLRAMQDHSKGGTWDLYVRLGALCMAMSLWGVANWYSCRIVLARQFPSDPLVPNTAFVRQWRTWFPRALAVVGLLWLGYWLPATAGSPSGVDVLKLAIWANAALVALFVIARRHLFRPSVINILVGKHLGMRQPEQTYPDLTDGDRLALCSG